MSEKDKRMKVVNELLNGIKVRAAYAVFVSCIFIVCLFVGVSFCNLGDQTVRVGEAVPETGEG